MLRINEISLPLGANTDVLRKEAAKTIGVSPDDFTYFSISKDPIPRSAKTDCEIEYYDRIGESKSGCHKISDGLIL